MILDILFVYSITLFVTFFILILQRKLLNRELLQKLREKNKELYELIRKQKVKEKEIERLYREVNELHMQLLPRQMLYMLIVLTVVYVIFSALKSIYQNRILIPLPISISFFIFKIQGGLGVLGTYILFSILNGIIIRYLERMLFEKK